ncbi:hypothetical protein AMK16_33240 [Streptomyces sp. CB00455]|nr:hypothetical protein AMK16_33240 [Streptomyces sp. CB00455]
MAEATLTLTPTVVDEEGESPDTEFLVDLRSLPRVPWHDGEAVAELVFEKMDRAQWAVLLEKLLEAHTDH